MKSILARTIALVLLVFGTTASTSQSAIIVSTGISLSPITLATAYAGTAITQITTTTNPGGQFFLSFKISDSEGQFITLDSVNVDISLNGVNVSSESYNTYNAVGNWNTIGVYGINSYGTGPMNQGSILVGCGTRNSASPYPLSMVSGDVLQAKMTYNAAGQNYTSTGTITYIPEPSSLMLLSLGVIGLISLRKRRC